jgi:hypothetical protein
MADEYTPKPRTRKRPFGVSVIILILILYTLLISLVFASSMGYQMDVGDSAVSELDIKNELLSVLLIYGLLPAFIIFEIAIAVGLWKLQRWAWVLLMVQVGLSMVSDLRGYFHGNPSYFTMLLDIVFVFYLNQREVQGVFEYSKDGRWAARTI